MNQAKKPATILLSGGGTGGSVTPLLAMAEELLKDYPDLNLVFVGSKNGPEQELVADFAFKKIEFKTILSGKWRRYFSWRNFSDPFKILAAFFQAGRILGKVKPALVISAGSFVSVPLVWAAAVRKIPVIIHQPDVRPLLANRLMAPFARVISVTFEKSLLDYGPRAVWIGAPLSESEITSAAAAVLSTKERYGLSSDKPFVLVIGGGTGSKAINELIYKSLDSLIINKQIIHLTGRGKSLVIKEKIANSKNYQAREFLAQAEVLKLLAAADLIISRAGLGALAEIALLEKPAIIIPLPRSHQEDNAAILKQADAAEVLEQDGLNSERLAAEINSLLADSERRKKIASRLSKVIKRGAAENLAGIASEILEAKK